MSINKISWAQQALEQIDEESMELAEQAAIENGIIVLDGDLEYTDEYYIFYYNQCH